MKRNLIIIKAVSGAGKSTFCDLISEPKAVCCADDYFCDKDGKYNFDANKLGHAHAYCRDKFDKALADTYFQNIIIANTNAKASDYSYYVAQAEKWNFKITYVVLEKRHNNKNIHDVPDHVLERQANSIQQNLKLL